MQNIQENDSHQFSSRPTSPYAANSCSRSWWNSSAAQIPPSSLSRSTSLNVDTPPQHCPTANQLGSQHQDQDSSSSQSTIQSHHEMATIGYDDTNGRQDEAQVKSVATQATPYFGLPPPQIDFNQSMTHLPYPYAADPYYGAIMATYGAPAMASCTMLPDMVGNPTRAPLPLEVADAGPIFVNAKQYHGILRRRQTRAKLEAQNRLVKPRKPYLHESRHLHAIKRVRGSGGRFLKQQSESCSPPDVENVAELACRQTRGNLSESDITNPSAPTTSCSDTTCLSNNEAPERLFSGYSHSQIPGTTSSQDSVSGNGMAYNGYQQFGVPINR
ncbi:hypothetical protein MKW94_021718 [Papaver nudicaule]|uniref:Nuclear transcription factor Y subunit n=1 Tax=Papaver nudicaule TaxID=74823 RepID=A0AA41VGP0_PAPNU|nr:hypothetical protein [Papaver nudicaule]